MSKVKHRKLQRDQDFRAIWKYRKSIPDALLGSINGADHRGYLLGRFQKENNYMSKKCRSQVETHDSGASPHPYCQIR